MVQPGAVLPEADPYAEERTLIILCGLQAHNWSLIPAWYRGEIQSLHHKKIVYTVKFLEDFVNLYWQEPVGVDSRDVRPRVRIIGLDQIH